MKSDIRTPEQLAIALARNLRHVAKEILADMDAHPEFQGAHLNNPRTRSHALFIRAETDAFLRRVLPPSKVAR